MNRDVDYRSDFYSLGIVGYEMLCGKEDNLENDNYLGYWDMIFFVYVLSSFIHPRIVGNVPFSTEDPLNLIFCHMAQNPIEPHAR